MTFASWTASGPTCLSQTKWRLAWVTRGDVAWTYLLPVFTALVLPAKPTTKALSSAHPPCLLEKQALCFLTLPYTYLVFHTALHKIRNSRKNHHMCSLQPSVFHEFATLFRRAFHYHLQHALVDLLALTSYKNGTGTLRWYIPTPSRLCNLTSFALHFSAWEICSLKICWGQSPFLLPFSVTCKISCMYSGWNYMLSYNILNSLFPWKN